MKRPRYRKTVYRNYTVRRLHLTARLVVVLDTATDGRHGWGLELQYGSKGKFVTLEAGSR